VVLPFKEALDLPILAVNESLDLLDFLLDVVQLLLALHFVRVLIVLEVFQEILDLAALRDLVPVLAHFLQYQVQTLQHLLATFYV